MNRTERAEQMRSKLFPGGVSEFAETDPEFASFFENFALFFHLDNTSDCIVAALSGRYTYFG